jgi:copper chaperone CopZ
MLWTATALVGAFVMFPNYVGFVSGSRSRGSARADATVLVSSEYRIEGMTCEGCANILRDALTNLPGVRAAEVDFVTKVAVVRYEPARPVPPERVLEAVKAAGYSATLPGETP